MLRLRHVLLIALCIPIAPLIVFVGWRLTDFPWGPQLIVATVGISVLFFVSTISDLRKAARKAKDRQMVRPQDE